jgi:hypothetical protein
MTISMSRIRAVLATVVLGLAVSACGYNSIPTFEEKAKARVSDADKSRLEAILDRHKAINVRERGQAYRSAGWKTFDEKAPAYTSDQVKKDRDLYRNVA